LQDHVTIKTPGRLETQAFVAPAHGSAFLVIDAIDPEGTLNAGVYERIRSVFDKLAPYEKELGGELCADVAVYFSGESRFDPAENGKDISEVIPGVITMPHWDAVFGACRSLQEAHIPYTIVTKRDLAGLQRFQVLVLPDVLVMDDDEVAAIKDFVENGGALYASCRSSLQKTDGNVLADFMLKDLFGVSFSGTGDEKIVYFTPAEDRFGEWIYPQDHMIHAGAQVLIGVNTAKIIATKTLPWTNPDKDDIFGQTFASIHSNPPGPKGGEPAVVLNKYGAGRAVYAAGALEAVNHDVNRRVFEGLVRLLLNKPAWFEAEAHRAVEVVLFHQPERKRMLISLVHSNEQLAGVALQASLRVRVPDGFGPGRLIRLPANTSVPYTIRDGYVEANVSGVDIFAMLALEYK